MHALNLILHPHLRGQEVQEYLTEKKNHFLILLNTHLGSCFIKHYISGTIISTYVFLLAMDIPEGMYLE